MNRVFSLVGLLACTVVTGCRLKETTMADVERGFEWIGQYTGDRIVAIDDTREPPDAKKITISEPGWFDVGVGSGIAFNTDDQPNNDASGVLATLKAYPFGRWYTIDGNNTFRAIRERNSVFNRFSVTYGVSTDDFSGGRVSGPIQAFGLGFDFTPELAIMGGFGFYEIDDGSRPDTDNGLYVGVVVNLKSFVDQYVTRTVDR